MTSISVTERYVLPGERCGEAGPRAGEPAGDSPGQGGLGLGLGLAGVRSGQGEGCLGKAVKNISRAEAAE